MRDLCRWLGVETDYVPANHPRAQGAVGRAGKWVHDVLSEVSA